jgi:hypothetical protein
MQLSRQSQNRTLETAVDLNDLGPAYTFLCRMTVILKPVCVRLEVPFQFLKEDRRPDSGWGSYHTRRDDPTRAHLPHPRCVLLLYP